MVTPIETETVDEFAGRAGEWIAANLSPIDPHNPPVADRGNDNAWTHARGLQKRLYEGGFAGICFPREYGGQGLDYAYQQAFNAKAIGYEMPLILNIPSFTICCATILDMGSEEQKRQHIPACLRGDEVLAQLLSEPNGGSDLAGVLTRAERRGDRWVINGAKTWTTAGFAADYGLCLARTDWDAPKHEGLTMFLVPIKHPGITIRRIKQVNGSTEFCEEFFDDVDVGDEAVVGEVNRGWDVASRQLHHERRTMGNGSEFSSGSGSEGHQDAAIDYCELAQGTLQADDIRIQEMAGRALVHREVSTQLSQFVYRAMVDAQLPPAAGAIIRLFHADTANLETDTAMAIAATTAVVGHDSATLQLGIRYLARQSANLGGGTTEIARNVIAERVLDLPREYAADRGVPFNQVRRNHASGSART